MNKRYLTKTKQRINFERERERAEVERRGWSRGARESFRARNNRKLSRIAARN